MKPVIDRTALQADAKELLDEARWLHDYHVQRGESAQQRAVAILGFAGILIALVPVASARVAGWQTWVLAVGLALVVLSALTSAMVMIPARSRALTPDQIRHRVVALAIEANADVWGIPSMQPAIHLTLVARDGEEVKRHLAGIGNTDAAEDTKSGPPRQGRAVVDPKAISMVEAERRLAGWRVGWLFASVVLMSLGVLVLAIPISSSVLDVSQTPGAPQTAPPQRPMTTPSPPPSWHSAPNSPTPPQAPSPTPAPPTKRATP